MPGSQWKQQGVRVPRTLNQKANIPKKKLVLLRERAKGKLVRTQNTSLAETKRPGTKRVHDVMLHVQALMSIFFSLTLVKQLLDRYGRYQLVSPYVCLQSRAWHARP